jgi:hypothetical protein
MEREAALISQIKVAGMLPLYYHDDITRALFEELGYNFTATF